MCSIAVVQEYGEYAAADRSDYLFVIERLPEIFPERRCRLAELFADLRQESHVVPPLIFNRVEFHEAVVAAGRLSENPEAENVIDRCLRIVLASRGSASQI